MLAGLCERGRNHGQDVSPTVDGHLALLDGFLRRDAASARVDGNASVNLVDDGLENELLLREGKNVAFAIRAEREDTVNAGLDLSVDLTTELLGVDGLVLVHGRDDRYYDAFQLCHLCFPSILGRFSR